MVRLWSRIGLHDHVAITSISLSRLPYVEIAVTQRERSSELLCSHDLLQNSALTPVMGQT